MSDGVDLPVISHQFAKPLPVRRPEVRRGLVAAAARVRRHLALHGDPQSNLGALHFTLQIPGHFPGNELTDCGALSGSDSAGLGETATRAEKSSEATTSIHRRVSGDGGLAFRFFVLAVFLPVFLPSFLRLCFASLES